MSINIVHFSAGLYTDYATEMTFYNLNFSNTVVLAVSFTVHFVNSIYSVTLLSTKLSQRG